MEFPSVSFFSMSELGFTFQTMNCFLKKRTLLYIEIMFLIES
jgi:hypothetical protein